MLSRHTISNTRIWAISVCFGVLCFVMGFEGERSLAIAFDNSEPVMAVDISNWSGTITESEVACWWESGIRHVISGTQIPSLTTQQLQTVVDIGLSVDAYVMLYWDYDITAQVLDARGATHGIVEPLTPRETLCR